MVLVLQFIITLTSLLTSSPCTTSQSFPSYLTMPSSLKQRLAALSIASSSPSSSFGADIPKSPSRRKFNTLWTKRNANESTEEEQATRDRTQEVMSKVIFQAGVDYESVIPLSLWYRNPDNCNACYRTRPMYVIMCPEVKLLLILQYWWQGNFECLSLARSTGSQLWHTAVVRPMYTCRQSFV